jgi:hypothetical protein
MDCRRRICWNLRCRREVMVRVENWNSSMEMALFIDTLILVFPSSDTNLRKIPSYTGTIDTSDAISMLLHRLRCHTSVATNDTDGPMNFLEQG